MSYDASNIINIATQISASGLAFANFAKATVFAPETELPVGFDVDTRRVYGSISDVSVDFNSTTETYKAAAKWLGAIPQPTEITVYARSNVTDSDTVVQTLDKARNQFWWYWSFFTVDVYTDYANIPAIAAWHDTTDGAYMPNCSTQAIIRDINDTSDIASTLTTQGTRHVNTFSHATDDYAGIALCAHFAAVNYSGLQTTITGEFKKLPGTDAEELTGTEYAAMKLPSKKAVFYTVVDLQGSEDAGRVINSYTHSAFGEYIDDVVNLDAFVNDLRVTLYNALTGVPTKLAQTPAGQQVLLNAAKETGERYIANQYLGPRNYTDPSDGLEKFTLGYEILTKAEDILNLSDSDRAERKAAPIRMRVYRAGAIHAVEVTVDVY